MFRTVPLSIIRSFFTVHTAMVYVIQVCWQLASGIRTELVLSWSCQQTCMTYTVAVCTMKNSWWWTEELSETCRFYSKNKFEKLVHLVGFIIRIYHDARSPERQICHWHIVTPLTKPNLPCSYCTWYFPVLSLWSFEKYSVIHLSFLLTSDINITKNLCTWHSAAYKINTSNWVCCQFNAHRNPATVTCHNCCIWQHVGSFTFHVNQAVKEHL